MLETLSVLAAVGLLAAIGLLGPLVPFGIWLWGGVGCALFGLLLGVPTGLWYHLRLRACLASRDALPPRWWLRPVDLHGALRPEERPGVLRWFWIGGVGFALTILGCAIVMLGVGIEWLRMAAWER